MIASIRSALAGLPTDRADHAGLLLDRYLASIVDKSGGDQADAQTDRTSLFEAVRGAVERPNPIYIAAFKRWKACLPPPPAQGRFRTDSRVILGLGGEHVTETGLTLHHTYGTPLLPGTALKGLASSYCHSAWGKISETYLGTPGEEGEAYRVLFGTHDEGGLVTFPDAWIEPRPDGSLPGVLLDDVLTPHHPDYPDRQTEPTEFDAPVPTTFLSVGGTFLIAVSPTTALQKAAPGGVDRWLQLALDALSEALREWGIGGKTSSGYGRLLKC